MASTGIGGIERKNKLRQELEKKNISDAFQDLNKLKEKASDMARLAQGMVERLKEKGNIEISQDETVLLKSCLLKLGIKEGLEDIVTREKYANENQYFRDLGKQIAIIIKDMMAENGGIMALTDVFCAVNRARGFDPLSSEDLLNACHTLKSQRLGFKLVKYDSGLMVLESENFNEEAMNEQTSNLVKEYFSSHSAGLTSQQLALDHDLSLSLARQRLVNCENCGLICRDESIQGLSFYPNKFLHSN